MLLITSLQPSSKTGEIIGSVSMWPFKRFSNLFSVRDETDIQLFSADRQLFTKNIETFSKSISLVWVSAME